MKNKILLLMGIISLCYVLSGCSSVGNDAIYESMNSSTEETLIQESENNSSEETSVEIEIDSSEAVSSETASAEIETDTTPSETPDNSFEEVYKSALAANISLAKDQKILLNCDDFDGNGEYEAFAFVGTTPVEDDEWSTYEGEIWYVDNDECVCLEPFNGYYNVLKCMDFGKRKYICFDQFYVTESPTTIYTVKDGAAVADTYSNIGNVYNVTGKDFSISLSAYDTTYDPSITGLIGHSWKPYYFYYDEAKDAICEYGAHEISMEEAANLLPDDAMNTILSMNGTVTTCILRDNGILNVNYEISYENGCIDYKNANYDTVNKRYLDAYGLGENSLSGSSFGGTYEINI